MGTTICVRASRLGIFAKRPRQGQFEEDGWRVRTDGSRFQANAILTALHDPKGTLVGFAKITRDLTESRRAEDAIQAAQAELARVVRVSTLGELTASMAHEVNQPLSANRHQRQCEPPDSGQPGSGY